MGTHTISGYRGTWLGRCIREIVGVPILEAHPGASPFDKPAPEGSAQTVSQVLGEIVWLMSQSPMHGAVRH